MKNVAIIQQDGGKYLFEVPEHETLKTGDRVMCDTKRGNTEGIAYADSVWADENIVQLIGKLTGAHFPLKSVIGKVEYKPFTSITNMNAKTHAWSGTLFVEYKGEC